MYRRLSSLRKSRSLEMLRKALIIVSAIVKEMRFQQEPLRTLRLCAFARNQAAWTSFSQRRKGAKFAKILPRAAQFLRTGRKDDQGPVRFNMLPELLNKLIARQDLAQAEAAALLETILTDEATDSRIAAALIALASKGETEEELAGFAQTMRARCSRIASKHSRYVDTCGTGGSVAKTFNVSTAAALVVAAAGVPVAKHGNVGVTTRAGSADVLSALGVKVDLAPERVNEIFDEIG